MTARFDMLIFGLRFDLFFRVVWRPGQQEAPALTAVLLRPRRLAWPRTSPFHGGNTGSNPVGDANKIKTLLESGLFAEGLKGFDKKNSPAWRVFVRLFARQKNHFDKLGLRCTLHRSD